MLILSVLFLINRINTGDYTIDMDSVLLSELLLYLYFSSLFRSSSAVQYQTITFQILFS